MRQLLMLLLCVIAVQSHAQSNEIVVNLKNGLLLSSLDVEQLQGDVRHVDVKNTLQQSIGVAYTRVLKSGVSLTGGLNVGYEKYSLKLNPVYEKYGYVNSNIYPNNYNISSTIPFAQINLGLGYRVQKLPKMKPEIRLGQLLHFVNKSARFQRSYFEKTVTTGFLDRNIEQDGHLGGASQQLTMEFINYLLINTNLPTENKILKRVRVGLQLQRQFIFNNNPANTIKATYYDVYGFIRSTEKFSGKHTSISLMLGYRI